MDEEYTITYVEKPEDSATTIIGQSFRRFHEQQAGNNDYKSLCLFLLAPDGNVVGGLIGGTYWNWLHIDLLWVREGLRGRGYGHRLLTLAEDEARQRRASNAYLDTFSFQAPSFYRRHGYEVFGEPRESPRGYHRYFLTKEL